MEFYYYILIILGVLAVIFGVRAVLIAYAKSKWRKLQVEMMNVVEGKWKRMP